MGKNTRGTKQQLLVDRAVVQDCKSRLTNLCTASIDYKKANELVIVNSMWYKLISTRDRPKYNV